MNCKTPWYFCLISGLILLQTSCQHQPTLYSVEDLPLDRFDDYMPQTVPPHPWHIEGKIDNDVTLSLVPDAESPFCDNKVTGKALVCEDKSILAGHGAGISTTFTPPPKGDLYLGFDFKYDQGPEGKDLGFIAQLIGKENRTFNINIGEKDILSIKDKDGKIVELYQLKPGQWYHFGLTVRKDKIAYSTIFDFQKNRNQEIKLPQVEVTLPEAINTLKFISNGPDAGTGSWTLDNICMAGDVAASRQNNWPFKLAPLPELRKSPKKVFAYYFIYGSGYDSRDPGLAWYTKTVRNPSGNKKPDRKGAGTELLYRPLPRPPMAGKLTKDEEMALARQEEIKLAIQQGLDGFLVDFWMVPHPKNGQAYFSKNSFLLLDGAAKLDPTFKIVPAVYCNTQKNGANGEADADVDPIEYANSDTVKRILKHPATFRLPDGRAVFSMWLTEKHTPEWWKKVIAECQKNGTPIALLGQFNTMGRLKDFAPICYAMAHWGPRKPGQFDWVKKIKELGSKPVFPIVEQDIRTRGCALWEAENSGLLRDLWTQAINDGADWAFIYSWSDFSEQAMQPSTCLGFAPYDLNSYFSQWFKTGKQPEITKDVLYYFHRQQHTEAQQLKGDKWKFNQGAAKNNIELVAFLEKPGRLEMNIAGKVYFKDAPAGITAITAPLPQDKSFVPEFSLIRNGKMILSGKSRYPVLDKVEFPNLIYCSGSITK